MGPNGSGKSTLAYSIAGHPKYTVTVGHGHPRRRGRAGDDRRRAGPRRAVPGDAVPGRGARRLGVELPAHGGHRDPRRGAEAADLGQGGERGHGRGWPSTRRSPSATSTRASPAARRSGTRSCSWSCCSPKIADPRRDRLRPGRRRAAGRLRGRQPGPRRRRGGRAAHHPLHPDPALHPARLRARVRRRPDRRGGRPGAGRRSSRPRATSATRRRRPGRDGRPVGSCVDRPGRRQDQGRLPDPGAHRARRAPAGLPGQRRHLAEAGARCSTPSGSSTSGTTPPCTAGRTSSPRRPPTPTRRARATVAGVHRRAARARWSSPRTPPRRSTWSPTRWPTRPPVTPRRRASSSAPGDEIVVTEMEHHANLVPWQELCRRTGADAALVRAHRRRPARPGRPGRRSSTSAPSWSRSCTSRTCSARSTRSAPIVAARPRGRRARACSTPASRCRTCRSTSRALGVDFVAFSGHKMLGPTGIGVLWGRRELLEAMPPFLTGGSMIEIVRDGGHAPSPPRRSGSRPASPMAAQAVGLAAAVRLPRPRSGWTPSPRTSTRSPPTRWTRLAEIPGRAGHRPARRGRPRRGGLVRRRGHPPARRRAGARRPGRRGAGRPPLRLAAVPALRRAGDHPGVARTSTTTAPTSTRSSTACGTRSASSGWPDAARGAVPGDHPRPLPAPRGTRAARAVRGRGAPRQPDLRRRGDPAASGWTATRSRTCPTRGRAARSARRRRRS